MDALLVTTGTYPGEGKSSENDERGNFLRSPEYTYRPGMGQEMERRGEVPIPVRKSVLEEGGAVATLPLVARSLAYGHIGEQADDVGDGGGMIDPRLADERVDNREPKRGAI
jgi:hypothetical protein